MNTLAKENYLCQVKNRMLFHFSHKEIFSTLEDVNAVFDSEAEDSSNETNFSFGNPNEFVKQLMTESSKRSTILFPTDFLCMIALCVVLFFFFYNPQNIALYALLLLFPILCWYVFGGICIFTIRGAEEKAAKQSLTYYSVTLFLGIFYQVMTCGLCTGIFGKNLYFFVKASYYFASVLTAIAFLLLLISTEKMYRGYSTSVYTANSSTGIICSSIWYMDYLKRFEAPGGIPALCVLPILISGILCCIYHTIKKRHADKIQNCLQS